MFVTFFVAVLNTVNNIESGVFIGPSGSKDVRVHHCHGEAAGMANGAANPELTA